MAVTPVVSPSTVTPGLYLTVTLIAGTASPGTGNRRICLMATKSSSGDLTDDTEVRPGTGADSASTAFGGGTVGHLAAKILYAKWPAVQVDFISPAAGSGSATLKLTAAGAPSAASVADVDVCGRTTELTWEVGETPTQFAAKITAWVNGQTDDLPVSAAAGGAGESDITSKVAGNVGNDFLVKATLRAQTGTETLTGAVTPTALSGGTTDPDLTNALAAIAGTTYRYILPCLSNTDAVNIATASNVSLVRTHINTYNTGLGARLQQQVVGYSGGTVATATAAVVHSNNGNNDGTGEMIMCINGRSAPAEFGAREVIGRAYATSLDPAANRIGESFDLVYGSHDTIADKPTAAEAEAAVGTGVSILSYNASEALYLVRAVTMHCQTGGGGTDRRLLDTQNVDAVYDIAEDVQTFMPEEFQGAKITADNDTPTTSLPANTVQPKDIKAWIIARMRYWERAGVIDGTALQSAIDNDEFIVEINASDASQVDIVIPATILPPLAKMGVEVSRIPA